MASDMLCCQGGTSGYYNTRTWPGPGVVVTVDMLVLVRTGALILRSAL
ncbi:hypothetical protein [Mycobacterium uberis]|nr:hypothetical protein [Mycobacterium uberis]